VCGCTQKFFSVPGRPCETKRDVDLAQHKEICAAAVFLCSPDKFIFTAGKTAVFDRGSDFLLKNPTLFQRIVVYLSKSALN